MRRHATRRTAPWARAAALAVGLILLALAAPAAGQIVFVRDQAVWVMADDGANPHLLAPRGDFPGAAGVEEVHVHPAGRTLAVEAPSPVAGQPEGHCGKFCAGVYTWRDGVGTRLSPPPAPAFDPATDAVPTTVLDGDPTVAADGTVVFTRRVIAGDPGNLAVGSSVVRIPGGAGAPEPLDLSCLFSTDVHPAAAVNPVDPSRVAYLAPCPEEDPDLSLVVAGADGYEIVGIDDIDGVRFAWAPDGAGLATSEQGDVPGIYVYVPGTNDVRQALSSDGVGQVAWTGDGRILFSRDGDLWSIPATCSECTFPASATRLTSGAGADSSPAWTAADVERPPAGGPDRDGDGVPDAGDRCPGQAGPPSNAGCPAPPAGDRDGDEVADAEDTCPDVAGTAAAAGCPAPAAGDQDGDGVVDVDDDCAAVPGPAGNDGCPLRRVAVPIRGTRAADRLVGTRRADQLFGGLGDDRLRGLGGDDLLVGGRGADRLEGGPGRDRLVGMQGDDILIGGLGVDRYDAGPGDDVIDSLDGVAEVVRCGPGVDRVRADLRDRLIGCERRRR